MSRRWFVTGTDTEVGKTVASCALLQAATRAGYRTAGYKPVASGSDMTPDGVRNSDALALQRNSSLASGYDDINPYVFEEPTSPHLVSRSSGVMIERAVMSRGLKALVQQADWVQVEGAGGWFTPLGEDYTFADWVAEEKLPVILVIGVKLGCINHAMLTAAAVQAAGLPLAGWIANDITPPGSRHQDYLASLQARIPAPMLGEIPWLDDPFSQDLGRYLNLALLV